MMLTLITRSSLDEVACKSDEFVGDWYKTCINCRNVAGRCRNICESMQIKFPV